MQEYKARFDNQSELNEKKETELFEKMIKLFAKKIIKKYPKLYEFMMSEGFKACTPFDYKPEYSLFISEKEFDNLLIETERESGRNVSAVIGPLMIESLDDESIMSKGHRYIKSWHRDETGKYTMETTFGSFVYWSAKELVKSEETLKAINIENPKGYCFSVAFRTVQLIGDAIANDPKLTVAAFTGTVLGEFAGQKEYHAWIELGEGENAKVIDFTKKKGIIMPVIDYYRLFVDFSEPVLRTSFDKAKNLPEEINKMQCLIYRYIREIYKRELSDIKRNFHPENRQDISTYDSILGREI